MRIINYLITMAAILSASVCVWADPVISSYAMVNETSLSIAGTGFGVKAAAEPLVWETVEGGFFDEGWTSTNHLTVNSDNNRHANSAYNARCNYSVGTYGFFTKRTTCEKVFAQYWFKLDSTWEWGTADGATFPKLSNIKFFRMYPESGVYANMPVVWHTFSGQNLAGLSSEGITPIQQMAVTPLPLNITKEVWHCQQFEYKESSGVDVADGELRYWFDGVLGGERTDIVTRSTANPSLKFPYLLGIFSSWGVTPSAVYAYFDDVYVDNTWARVEIGNAAVYGDCTQREMQMPLTWSDTSIAFTTNIEAFEEGIDLYIFATDLSGAASNGQLISEEVQEVIETPSTTGAVILME